MPRAAATAPTQCQYWRTCLGRVEKQAWIQDPKTASTARFHWDPKSWSQDPWYFVDSGRPLTGAPPLLKTRRHMRRNDARKLWLALKERGWRLACRCYMANPSV